VLACASGGRAGGRAGSWGLSILYLCAPAHEWLRTAKLHGSMPLALHSPKGSSTGKYVGSIARQREDLLPVQYALQWCRAFSAPRAVRRLSSGEIHKDESATHLDRRLARCVDEWRCLHTGKRHASLAPGASWHERNRCRDRPACRTGSRSDAEISPGNCLLFPRSDVSAPKRTRWYPPTQPLIREQAMEAFQQYRRTGSRIRAEHFS
jgi:hypothetical protein